MDLRIVALPAGEDPDSFVKNHGAKAFRELLGQAVSFIDFKAAEYRKLGLFDTPEGKAKAVRAIVQSISRISDELKRSFFIKDVAERYGLYESVLWKEMEKAGRGEKGDGRRGESPVVPLGRLGAESRQSTNRSFDEPMPSATTELPREVPTAERAVLKLFLELRRDAIEYLMANLHEDDVTDPRVNALIQKVLHDVETAGTFDVASAIQSTEDQALRDVITDTLMARYEISRSWENAERQIEREDPMKVAHDAVFMLRRATLKRAIDQNQAAMRQAAREGRDTGEFLRNQQELMEMTKRLEAEAGRKS
jgi:DNA primase